MHYYYKIDIIDFFDLTYNWCFLDNRKKEYRKGINNTLKKQNKTMSCFTIKTMVRWSGWTLTSFDFTEEVYLKRGKKMDA